MSDIYPEDSNGAGRTRAAESLKDDTRDRLGEAGQAVKQEAAHFAESARDKAHEKVESGQEAAATALGSFADAVRKAGDDLGQQDQTMAARLAGQAAEGLEGLSRAVSEKSPEDLMRAVRDFGRANPAAFVAGAVLAGVALGRFVRSSSHHEAHGRTDLTPPQAWPGESGRPTAAGEAAEAIARTGIADQSPGFGAEERIAVGESDANMISEGAAGYDVSSMGGGSEGRG